MEDIVINGDKYSLLDITIERNSGGRLDKIWIQNTKTGLEYLVKTSTPTGLEPYSEVMAYQIGKALGFPVVEYWLVDAKVFNGVLKRTLRCRKVSVCRRVDGNGTRIRTIKQIKDMFNEKSIILNLNEKYTNTETAKLVMNKNFLDNMLLFDAIIGNKDRHWRNVHLLEKYNGGFIECPFIDNGDSLLATDVLGDAGILWSYLANKFNKSSTLARTHDKQVESITTIKFNKGGINIDSLVNNALMSIETTLRLLPKSRGIAIRNYLSYRIRKYYSMLSH